METGYITIDGKQIPLRRSLGAFRRFDERFKDEGITTFRFDLSKATISHMLWLLWECIDAGHRFTQQKNTITISYLEDALEFDDLAEITRALMPQREEVDGPAETEKKSYKGGE
jgi:hypothetical protein